MANGHGGARPGSGRKRKAEKFEAPIAAAEERIADKLPKLINNLLYLANGKFEQVSETYEPAGTIMVDSTEIEYSDNGPRALKVKKRAFPDKEDDELVLTRRVVTIAAPDRNANEYLINRIMGTPTQHLEHTGEDGDAIPFAIVRVPAKATPEEWQQSAQAHKQKPEPRSEPAPAKPAAPKRAKSR